MSSNRILTFQVLLLPTSTLKNKLLLHLFVVCVGVYGVCAHVYNSILTEAGDSLHELVLSWR